jgi:hypothetical protein
MPIWKASKTRRREPAAPKCRLGAYFPSKYPRINSRLKSLGAHTRTITAPPPKHHNSVPGSRQTATLGSPSAAKLRVEVLRNVVVTSVSPTLAGRDSNNALVKTIVGNAYGALVAWVALLIMQQEIALLSPVSHPALLLQASDRMATYVTQSDRPRTSYFRPTKPLAP